MAKISVLEAAGVLLLLMAALTTQAPTIEENAAATQAPTTAAKEETATTQAPTMGAKEETAMTQAPTMGAKEETAATQAPTTGAKEETVTTKEAATRKQVTKPVITTKPCGDPCEFGFCAAYPNATCRRSKQDPCKPEFQTPDGMEIHITRCGTKCSDDCSWDYDPHCATDGKTYQNLCRLNFAKCISGGLFTLIRRKSYIGKGQCVKIPSDCKSGCAAGVFCPKAPNSFCKTSLVVCYKDFYDWTTKSRLSHAQCEDACGQPPESSSCFAYIPRWYYNPKEGHCKLFIWGGCEQNDNNFETEKDCMQACKGFKGTKCSEECPDDVDEYCATNGVTYKNICHLNVANCRSKGKIVFVHKGPCGLYDIDKLKSAMQLKPV